MLTGSLAALLFWLGFCSGDDPLVETKLGKVLGRWEISRSERRYAAFNAIPFAKPPIKELRFQASVALDERWNTTFNGSLPRSHCPQPARPGSSEIAGSEDCLYLSVATHNVSGRAPVLVHIHGGAFNLGHSSGFGHDYLMDHDLVVVGINYRLGALGFLSLEDELIPGNQGMKDQVMGLRWVKDNIHLFGGDPNKVTLIGESAGSACVFHHIVSPLSRGLFHGVIAESGTSYGIWTVSPIGFPRSLALKSLKSLNCSTVPKEAVKCALSKPFQDIVKLVPADLPTTFGPVFERGSDPFLTWPIDKWQHSPVPLLMGVTSAEGLLKTGEYASNERFSQLSRDFDSKMPFLVGYNTTSSNPDNVTKEIRRYYGLEKNITMDDWVTVTNIFSDSLFFTPAQEGANRHTGPVYFYFFDYILKELTPELSSSQLFGAFHTTEAFFIWNTNFRGGGKLINRPEDVSLSKTLVKLVANFATYGTVNVTGSTDDSLPKEISKWEMWTNQTNNYMYINKTGFHPSVGFPQDRKKFWDGIILRDKYNQGWNHSTVNKISAVLLIFASVFSFSNLL